MHAHSRAENRSQLEKKLNSCRDDAFIDQCQAGIDSWYNKLDCEAMSRSNYVLHYFLLYTDTFHQIQILQLGEAFVIFFKSPISCHLSDHTCFYRAAWPD